MLAGDLHRDPGAVHRSKVAQVNENAHAVQLALERFAVDDPHCYYPISVQQAIAAGYLPELPVNPFTGHPVRFIERGAPHLPGDICYVPVCDEDGKVIAYELYGY